MIDETRVDQRFTAADIRRMHRLWLGEIYVWAGEYRQVNMAKGEFMFAAANHEGRRRETISQQFTRP
jgi:cell filamentation protein